MCEGREGTSSPSAEPPERWGKVCLEKMGLETTFLTLGTKTHGCDRLIFLALFSSFGASHTCCKRYFSPSWFPTHQPLLPSATAITASLPVP